MKDGVKLAADIILPDNLPENERIPTLLYRTRYWRDAELKEKPDQPASILHFFTSYGYAIVKVDVGVQEHHLDLFFMNGSSKISMTHTNSSNGSFLRHGPMGRWVPMVSPTREQLPNCSRPQNILLSHPSGQRIMNWMAIRISPSREGSPPHSSRPGAIWSMPWT